MVRDNCHTSLFFSGTISGFQISVCQCVCGATLRISKRGESKKEQVIFVVLYFIDMVPDMTAWLIKVQSKIDKFKSFPFNDRNSFPRL